MQRPWQASPRRARSHSGAPPAGTPPLFSARSRRQARTTLSVRLQVREHLAQPASVGPQCHTVACICLGPIPSRGKRSRRGTGRIRRVRRWPRPHRRLLHASPRKYAALRCYPAALQPCPGTHAAANPDLCLFKVLCVCWLSCAPGWLQAIVPTSARLGTPPSPASSRRHERCPLSSLAFVAVHRLPGELAVAWSAVAAAGKLPLPPLS